MFALRDRPDDHSLAGFSHLALEGLAPEHARELLAFAIPGPMDERVRDRIVAETRGNPLALLELPRGMTYAELAGGFGLPGSHELSARIEASYQRQLASLYSPIRGSCCWSQPSIRPATLR